MKNKTSILTLLLGAMIILASCNSEEIPGVDFPAGDNMPIEFSGVHAWVDTKDGSGDDDEVGPTLPETFTGFKVWASRSYKDANNIDQIDTDVFSDGTEVLKEVAGESSVAWKYSPLRYWQPGEYNFFAVSPTNISSSIPIGGDMGDSSLSLYFGESEGETYSGWDLKQNQVDLLYASAPGVTGRFNSTNTPVNLTFDHMLSKLSFSVGNKTTDKDITISAIKIYGNKKIATSYTSSDTFALNSVTSADNSYYEDSGLSYSLSAVAGGLIEYTTIISELFAFPEECNITVELTISLDADASGYTKSSTSTPVEWKAGKHYHYQINIAPDNVSFSEPLVVDWNNGGAADSDNIIM